jgi:TatD DNase family protein
MLFDSHAHLGSPELWPQADALLARARAAGVRGVLAVGAGWGIARNEFAMRLAAEHADVWASVGVHPHDASEWGETAARDLEGWLAHEQVVAVGECGLDYWYENSPREVQRECLRAHVRLACRVGLPLVIHMRPARDDPGAYAELLAIFDEENADRAGGVIHCFTGERDFAEECLARGFDISFSGILTFPKADALREVARALPLDCLMIETDSPLLAPVPHRGKRNEPAFVARVAACLADLHGVSREEVAARTHARACARFALGGAP